MTQKKLIFKISTAIILLSILLLVISIFSYIQIDLQISSLKRQQGAVLGATNIPQFDPNYVMSNETFSSTRAFPTQESVQNYLDKIDSPLKNYKDQGKLASYWIFNSARGVTSSKWGIKPQLNPGVLLAYLEKEQSLLSLSDYNTAKDPSGRIRKAMGYGCPDTGSCDSKYNGLANQVNWASYQLAYNYRLSTSSTPDRYKLNTTITTLDEYNVFLTNQATAANYRYTPHVYWGNYNLWKIITANGWGVNQKTWNSREIDSYNLNKKDKPEIKNLPKISESKGLALAKKTYRLGEKSDQIGDLQIFLRQKGYYTTRDINNLYGTITKEAHTSYRRDSGVIIEIKDDRKDSCQKLIFEEWSIGQESQQVKELQKCLREMGVFSWPSNTGYFGTVTQEALTGARKAWQKDQKQDQKQDSKTEKKAEPTECERLLSLNWTTGQRSSKVKELQDCLTDTGHFRWPHGSTGYFGPVTQEALNKARSEIKNQDKNQTKNNQEGQNENPAKPETACDKLINSSWTTGQRSSKVKELQDCLTDTGHFRWPHGSTGYFGPVTQEALNKARNQNRNSQNTQNGQSTDSVCEALKNRKWVFGERSNEVRKLQKCMRDAGVFNWPHGNTGYFGNATKESIIKWRGFF
jgi:peptidoglycan hydrolase-like protein with peptidoglycan-binding domain